MSSRIRWTILALALVGLGLSVASLVVHHRLLTDPSYASPCDVNATFSCSQAYLSQYGSLGGVPVAFGGVIWFGLVAAIVAFAATERPTSTASHYVLGLSVIGLVVIAYLAYVSYFVLKSGCPLCLATYACVLGIAALSKFATTGSIQGLFAHIGEDVASLPSRPAGFAAGVLVLGATLLGALNFPTERSVAAARSTADSGTAGVTADFRTRFTEAWNKMPRTNLGIAADGATVVVVKFNDFACPICRQAEDLYKPILKQFETSHPGQVKYVFKDYPLNTSCNAHMQQTLVGHEGACYAAAAFRAAQARNKTDELLAWIWANQSASADAVRTNASRILGLTGPEFDSEYAKYLPAIRQDVADGVALNITGTPTYFINGVRMPEALMPVQSFTLAIELELEKAPSN
jgi:uncharacterized membrane protein/protein-disulfide isomerase